MCDTKVTAHVDTNGTDPNVNINVKVQNNVHINIESMRNKYSVEVIKLGKIKGN